MAMFFFCIHRLHQLSHSFVSMDITLTPQATGTSEALTVNWL